MLSKIAKIQTQTACSPTLHGFKSKYNFFKCFVPTWQNHIKSIEDVLRNYFILPITGE